MINILSKQSKEKVKKIYRLRVAIVALEALLIVLIIGSVLLVPVLMFVIGDASIIREQAGKIRASEDFVNNSKLREEVRATSQQMRLFSALTDRSIYQAIIVPLFSYADVAENGIRIQEIVYTQQKDGVEVQISGVSETRRSLTAFIRTLQEDSRFEKVASPISNLVENNDITFSLSLETTHKRLYEE